MNPNLLYLLAWLTEADGPGWHPCAHQPQGTLAVERGDERVTMVCKWNSGDPTYYVRTAPDRLDVPPFRAWRGRCA